MILSLAWSWKTKTYDKVSRFIINSSKHLVNLPGPLLLLQVPFTLSISGMRRLHCELNDAPTLLKREVAALFPDRDIINKNLSVITLSQRTTNDMTGWSDDIEKEREALVEHFVSAAKELCGRLKNDGYWSDFIDPASGKPYYGQYTNTTMFETDEKFRLLGFRIEDLGIVN